MIDFESMAQRFANKNKRVLVNMYADAKKLKKLPSLADYKTEIIAWIATTDLDPKTLADERFLEILHLHARQFHAEEVIKSRKAEAEEYAFQCAREKLDAALVRHAAVFYSRMKRAVRYDPYGEVVSDKRFEEFQEFCRSQKIHDKRRARSISYERRLFNHCKLKLRAYESNLGIQDADSLRRSLKDGQDFEIWVATCLKKFGWETSVTSRSGDQGVDVIAKKGALRVAIQCKFYQGSVGNKAVQEVIAGMQHMDLNRAVVISTGEYTKSAQDLANSTGVLLLSEHDVLALYDLLMQKNFRG